MGTTPLKVLNVEDLTVEISGRTVLERVSLDISGGKTLALVGESGSGKTMTALAVMDLLPVRARRISGKAELLGRDVFTMSRREKTAVRGARIGMVFQEPFTALNPVMKAGEQIAETVRYHERVSGREVDTRVRSLLDKVSLPRSAAASYPHELSGGMRQRIMMAIALSCGPELLILDEPTTALDVSVQKRMLELVVRIQRTDSLAVLFITHDLSVVDMVADEVCVMKGGNIVERGKKEDVLLSPSHEYTRHLLDCIPKLGDRRKRLPA